MPEGGYNQFCPVAMAAEILGARWTLVLLRELLVGSTRFNDLRRGVPRMSPPVVKAFKGSGDGGNSHALQNVRGPGFFRVSVD